MLPGVRLTGMLRIALGGTEHSKCSRRRVPCSKSTRLCLLSSLAPAQRHKTCRRVWWRAQIMVRGRMQGSGAALEVMMGVMVQWKQVVEGLMLPRF